MKIKEYTAQEMREMADAIINECEDEEAGLVYESPAKAGHIFYPDEASAMLRQAAEMLGRCEEKRKELDEEWFYDGAENLTIPMNECYKIVDYILRGDAGEEEERERR